ncbi:MAG TPA: DUF456 domain-containing protein [Propionibacteriaceae bacterium]|nr:DUF456 domain-containing protein [Propionibacteriaceae bacterium]
MEGVELAIEILVGIAIAVGLIGIVITVLPGSLLIGGAVLVWALYTNSAVGWWTFAIVAVLVTIGMIWSKWEMARHTQKVGTSSWSLVCAGVLGIVGFFVIPVIGLVIGFVLGLWLAEYYRLRDVNGAWTSAKAGLRGTGVGILIELGTGLLAASVWLIAAIYT